MALSLRRRVGVGIGDALSTVGEGWAKNQELDQAANERQQAMAQAKADFDQRQQLAEQARADAEHQFLGLHQDLAKNPDGSFRPATPLENPQPFIQGLSEAKTPEDIQGFLQQYQAKVGQPAWQLAQASNTSPEAAMWQKLGAIANARNTNVIQQARDQFASTHPTFTGPTGDQTVQAPYGGGPVNTAPTAQQKGAAGAVEADAAWLGEKRKLDYEEQLREQLEAKKEQARKLSASQGAQKGLPMADLQLGQLADLWDKANAGSATVQPKLGLGGMVSAFGHHLLGQAPAWAQSQVNPSVTLYNSARAQASVPVGIALSGGGSRGAAIAKIVTDSLPAFGTDPATGKAQIQQLRNTLRYYPAAVQLTEDHPGEDLWGTMQRWQAQADAIRQKLQASGQPLPANFRDPETGVIVPLGGGS